PLLAHNFGDLDRVMVAWQMEVSDPFCKSIFKLGHKLNDAYSDILVYTGKVNKEFTSPENHRHLSLRKPKCLRKSKDFLIPVGPFMDDWGATVGACDKLSLEEKAEIVVALFDGWNREKQAFGYARGFGAMINNLPNGFKTLESYLAFDIYKEIQKSKFFDKASQPREEFEQQYINALNKFSF
ncbi:MAG: hypothetical protein OEW87_15690, partial [Flavobacteriaceae bacterium]|nr:hypothetical protein [Flavobacteriaceae bacterium]